MTALTDFAENLALDWLLTTGAATRPTTWFIALHTGDPGETGDANEVLVATDADYVRKSITFNAASAGQSTSAAQVSWTVNSGSSGYTVTHISVCESSTAGNVLFKGALLVPRALVANSVLTFNTGDIVAALD